MTAQQAPLSCGIAPPKLLPQKIMTDRGALVTIASSPVPPLDLNEYGSTTSAQQSSCST